MNLLHDKWVPVLREAAISHITYSEVLCSEGDWQLALGRDDLELAALQLLICLTQVVFAPDNKDALRRREHELLSPNEFRVPAEPYHGYFNVRDANHPFMQTKGITAKESTGIQKLLPGLPSGNNHAMFNTTYEVAALCESCAAIALFNQANNCPSFGGGFKGSLRGAAPLTTLVKANTLRQTIWRNVLDREYLNDLYQPRDEADLPTWIDPITRDQTIVAGQIGVFRGLFWQPAHVELSGWQDGLCQLCNRKDTQTTTEFSKEKFGFKVLGNWRHPHSPREWWEKNGALEERYVSFTKAVPAWTQLACIVTEKSGGKKGYERAPIIGRYEEVFPNEPLNLIVGGYCNNQAAIVQRRHEMLSLAEGWDANLGKLRDIIELAASIKSILRSKIYGFGKQIGLEGLAQQAEESFYQMSEGEVHQFLKRMNWKEAAAAKRDLSLRMANLARVIFNEITTPYQHEPKMIRALAVSRRSLEKELNSLCEGAYS